MFTVQEENQAWGRGRGVASVPVNTGQGPWEPLCCCDEVRVQNPAAEERKLWEPQASLTGLTGTPHRSIGSFTPPLETLTMYACTFHVHQSKIPGTCLP